MLRGRDARKRELSKEKTQVKGRLMAKTLATLRVKAKTQGRRKVKTRGRRWPLRQERKEVQ